MPKIINYRRTRHVDLDEVDENMRLQMQRNRVRFTFSYENDSYSYNDDIERDEIDYNIAKHTQGYYSLVTDWRSEYDVDNDQYVGRMVVDLMFELPTDLDSYEKNYVLLHKLSN